MKAQAWGGVAYGSDGTGGQDPSKESSSVTYEGYFASDINYIQNSSNVWQEAGIACVKTCTQPKCWKTDPGYGVKNGFGCTSASKPWGTCLAYGQTGDCTNNTTSGSHLNFLNMSRMDLVTWALTGGKPAGCSSHLFDPNYCDPELWSQSGNSSKVGAYCNNSVPINDSGTVTGGCTLQMTNGTKVNVPWSSVNGGLINGLMNLSIQPRLGALFFGGYNVYPQGQVYVGDFTASNLPSTQYPYKNLITALNSIPPNLGSTPTGPAMWDTLNYFQQTTPQYGGLPVQTGSSDKWKNPMYVCDSTGSNCTLIPCAKNFVMLLSDGQWNTKWTSGGGQTSCSISDTDSKGHSTDPVVAAYTMHEGFTNALANYQTNVSEVYTLGLFTDSTGDLAMRNIAMYGSFDTAHGTWPDGLTGYPQRTCSMIDCGSGKGSECTPLPASSPDWDYNGDNLPDSYFWASDALGIKDAVYTAIMDALRRVTSGTAVSILTSSGGSGANILQAVFYPDRAFDNATDITWTSEMQNLWYYLDPFLQTQSIREDTVQDDILNLSNDRIAEFFFDLTQQKARIHLWSDAGDGTRQSE